MTTTNTNMNTNFITISFLEIASNYRLNDGIRADFNEIFANVSSYIFWSNIREMQKAGSASCSDRLSGNENLMMCFLEKPEYVENRIRVSLIKTIRKACALNTLCVREGGTRFLMRRFRKNDEGLYDFFDAQDLAEDIAAEYEKHVGKKITETRWNMK